MGIGREKMSERNREEARQKEKIRIMGEREERNHGRGREGI